MVTAYVFSGGGSLGAAQVGALRALSERGIHPDVVGTSAGSLNAASVAGRGDDPAAMGELARVWTGLRRRDVFPVQAMRVLLAGAGRRQSLCPPEPLADLLRRHLRFTRLEDALLPLHVVTADELSDSEVVLSAGDAVEALLASCAVPGILPSVRRDGRLLCDGALARRGGIARDVELHVLPPLCPLHVSTPRRTRPGSSRCTLTATAMTGHQLPHPRIGPNPPGQRLESRGGPA